MRLTRPHFQDAPAALRMPPAIPATDDDSGSIRIDQTTADGTVLNRRQFTHYELLEVMGEGQFGTVWRAKDRRLDRIVALKLPHLADWDEEARARFLREARAAATLEHPHIVRVHGIDQEGDQPGIVSQFIVGRTLDQLLQDERLTFSDAARLLTPIAEAVHHAHEAGVIHRDLKPSNILVDNQGQPHVSDFGLAKWSGDQATISNPGLVMGTPAYMSPEQARGDSHAVDRRSDVYSLGVLLYEMLTGNPPFEGKSSLFYHQIQSQQPVSPRQIKPDLPKDLEAICLKCLAKSPDARYRTAQELADELRRFLAGVPIASRSLSLSEHCVSWTRRNPTLAASLAFAAVSTVVALGLAISMFSFSQPASLAAATELKLNVSVVTDPPGASLVIYPLDPFTGEPINSAAHRPTEKSPTTVALRPGDYLVVAALDGIRFHEVYRGVPKNELGLPDYYPHRYWERVSENTIAWSPIAIPEAQHQEMVLLEGRNTDRPLNPYWLDQREVTVQDFLRGFHGQLPPSLQDRLELLGTPDLPLTGLFYDEAVMFAEMVGKRLPTAAEYEFAATNGWKTRFPWGDELPPDDAGDLQEVGGSTFDRTQTAPPIFGLFSNAGEFVSTIKPSINAALRQQLMQADQVPSRVAIRGSTIQADLDSATASDPTVEAFAPRMSAQPHVGFRCVKSKSPRL